MSRALAAAVGVALVAGVGVLLARAPGARAPAQGLALPGGWTRYRGRVTPELSSAARLMLGNPLGSITEIIIGGETFGAWVEWHVDPSGRHHKGISLLVRP